jgi:hypothetical protein
MVVVQTRRGGEHVRDFFKALNMSTPVYVTRKDGDGRIMSYSMSAWMTLLAMAVIWLNVVAWGIFGMVELWRIW